MFIKTTALLLMLLALLSGALFGAPTLQDATGPTCSAGDQPTDDGGDHGDGFQGTVNNPTYIEDGYIMLKTQWWGKTIGGVQQREAATVTVTIIRAGVVITAKNFGGPGTNIDVRKIKGTAADDVVEIEVHWDDSKKLKKTMTL